MTDFTMADAAFPVDLDGTSFPAVAGYFGGPNAYNVWATADWGKFPGYKLPIWVAGYDGYGEGHQAVNSLKFLNVPAGSCTAIDLEGRVDNTYLNHYGQALHYAGYKVWVYGSASTVFGNVPLNGYWVADYAGIGPFMYDHAAVRATQYASGPNYDLSLVKEWVQNNLWQ